MSLILLDQISLKLQVLDQELPEAKLLKCFKITSEEDTTAIRAIEVAKEVVSTTRGVEGTTVETSHLRVTKACRN